jgi:sec-independent protein translocase protein TatA
MAFENGLIILMLVGLVFFGSKRLPELARAIGRSQVEFERARSETINESRKEILGRDITSSDIEGDTHGLSYRAKLEKAALRAGIQDPKQLTDEELAHAVRLYLEEK